MTKKQQNRVARLLPDGQPRYVRCYDNGGTGVDGGSIDRYTVVFSGATAKRVSGGVVPYLAMNDAPFHPQGFGQHGETPSACDVNAGGFAPAIGRKNHLGVRILFMKLPDDCKTLVLRDYKEIWSL